MIVGATGRRRPSNDQNNGGDRTYDHPLLLSTRTSLPPSHGASLLGSCLAWLQFYRPRRWTVVSPCEVVRVERSHIRAVISSYFLTAVLWGPDVS